MNIAPNHTGKFCILSPTASVSFTESRECKTSLFQFFVSSSPVCMLEKDCVCSVPTTAVTWTQVQFLDEVVMRFMATGLLLSFLIMYCYKFNTSKLCYGRGASGFCCRSETGNAES